MIRRFGTLSVALLIGAAGLCSPVIAQSSSNEPPMKAADVAKLADGLAGAMVQVEYTLQYDKGEEPGGWSGGNSGSYRRYMPRTSYSSWSEYIKEERPAAFGGYLVAPDLVVTSDPKLHPRFVKSMAVRFGDKTVNAKVHAHAATRDAWILKLDAPLAGTKPVTFDAKAEGPFFVASYELSGATWAISLGGAGGPIEVTAEGRRVIQSERRGVVVNKAGVAVGVVFGEELPVDESWKGSPADWKSLSAKQMDELLASNLARTESELLRCRVDFRSPRTGDGDRMSRYMMGSGGDETTEWNGVAIVLDDKTALVLANLEPKTTGRLERVRLFAADGTVTTAKFAGTLKDYGAFLVTLDKPVGKPAKMYVKDPRTLRDELLVRTEIRIRGEDRTVYSWRDRVAFFALGHKQQIEVSSAGHGEGESFLHTQAGELAIIPITRREKVAVQDRWGYSGSSGEMAAIYIADILKDTSKAIDAENRPLTEEEENRLAWLGVEMQGMDLDLARANNVVSETNGGRSGAIVTFIYEGSPAAKAGLAEGDILLRLHVEGQPKPIDVSGGGDDYSGMFDQYWAMLDQMPAEAFDGMEGMPTPWGAAETPVTRALTDIGFGTPFTADVFRGGKVQQLAFKVEQGPAHYASAKRFKSEAAGVTVRDLTYEVRRYFQYKNDDPGVIVSKIEKGGRSAVAGLRPYEVVTAVNDKPVKTAAEFEEAIKAGGDFRLSVKRMTEGRIVKMKVDAAKAEAKADAKSGEDAKPAEGDKKPDAGKK